MGFLDVITDVVFGSGRATSRTSGDWASWAAQGSAALSEGSSVVRDVTVGDAMETYATDWNPTMHRIAGRVDNLGLHTAAASNAVADGDATSASTLATPDAAVAQNQSNLSHDINIGRW